MRNSIRALCISLVYLPLVVSAQENGSISFREMLQVVGEEQMGPMFTYCESAALDLVSELTPVYEEYTDKVNRAVAQNRR